MTRIRIGGSLAPRMLATALLACAVAVLAAPTAMAAEGDRVFNPQLSLVGGCVEEELDPVEDPGCPTTPPPSAHPAKTFASPRAVATDFYGNIYVASFGAKAGGSEGRIDIFSPQGIFISELKPPYGPKSLALDSQGTLYVVVDKNDVTPNRTPILRYTPCAPYEPEASNIEYCNPPVALAEVEEASLATGLAINQDNDHLFANFGSAKVVEYGSAEEGNPKIRATKAAEAPGGIGMAVDAIRDRLYASAGLFEERIDIFDLTSITASDEYEKIGSIEDSALPAGSFGGGLSIAVDEETSHVFILDGENCHLYEFDENDEYSATIEEVSLECTPSEEIGVDNGPFSPNKGVLYVPSHPTKVGHSFAFVESQVDPPKVESLAAANITEDEAELQAQINPHNLETTYTFEYITAQLLGENKEEAKDGFTGATVAGGGTIPAGNLEVEVAAVAAGLQPGTEYRFRVVAENEKGTDEAQGSFATYPSPPLEPVPCPNVLVRIGPSALLPDCRAYELVSPPDTNGRAPLGTNRFGGTFTNRQVSPAGDKVPFRVEGGSLPGLGGVAPFFGDPYLSSRSSAGWSTTYIGPSPAEATSLVAGTTSPDQGYEFWIAQGSGSLVLGLSTNYVRYPDGHSEPIGQGSEEGIDPEAVGELISEGGDHIIFSSAVQLEPEAAPTGTGAIYDRVPNPETGERETKVVSLKPGEIPFGEDEDAIYQGASLDGEGVAFEAKGTLYLRYRNEATFEIGEGVDFAGIAEGGGRVFYLQGGDLKAFDASAGVITFADTAVPVVPVIVSPDGSAAYFVSESAIAGSGPNPNEAEPQAEEQNLYLSEEGQISFVGVLTDRDVQGELGASEQVDGLGLWLEAIAAPRAGRLAVVPARTTPDGGVLLFKSRAVLDEYNPEDQAEIYRYDSAANELRCLSCNPTGAAASGDATLQSETRGGRELFASQAWLENLRSDGRRAFFESSEPLVAHDSDGLQDVYEWEDQGVGSCTAPGGCLYLISSPHSLRDEYLWAVSQSGEDVFFLSSELLVGRDADETPSIYDARVGGGFPEPEATICQGEGCRPGLSPPPVLPGTLTPVLGKGDNVKPKPCPKGKHRVKRHGKVRCVKKHKHRRHRAGAKQRGGRR